MDHQALFAAVEQLEEKYIKVWQEICEIEPARCSECVGFCDEAACLSVCPVEAPEPDGERVESEALLLERARSLHPDRQLPELETLPASLSRFRKERN